MRMSKERRLVIYRSAIGVIMKWNKERIVKYNLGLCYAMLNCDAFCEGDIDPYNDMRGYPEIKKYKPKTPWNDMGYWFSTEDGGKKRIQILNQAIEELNAKISKK